MSATLGALLKQLEPDWTIAIYERLGDVAHGELEPVEQRRHRPRRALRAELHARARRRHGRHREGRQHQRAVPGVAASSGRTWSTTAPCPSPSAFINTTPHMSFVRGEENVDYLRRRYEALQEHPLFAGHGVQRRPRPHRSVGAAAHPGRAPSAADRRDAHRRRAPTSTSARSPRSLFDDLQSSAAPTSTSSTRSPSSRSARDGTWRGRMPRQRRRHAARGRRALRLRRRRRRRAAPAAALRHPRDQGLRRVPDQRRSSCAPTTPRSSRSTRPRSTARPPSAPRPCRCRTSTRASSTARPACCSARTRASARSSSRTGSWLDLFASIRPHNIVPMLAVGLDNLDLMKYLVGELLGEQADEVRGAARVHARRRPGATGSSSPPASACRSSRRTRRRAACCSSAPRSSPPPTAPSRACSGRRPGASTAVPIMLDVLERCFPDRIPAWSPTLGAWSPPTGSSWRATRSARRRRSGRRRRRCASTPEPPQAGGRLDARSNMCSTAGMRWSGQAMATASDSALPGLARLNNLVRVGADARVRGRDLPRDARQVARSTACPGATRALPFGWTINPYRGCSHACVYCFARPTHDLPRPRRRATTSTARSSSRSTSPRCSRVSWPARRGSATRSRSARTPTPTSVPRAATG